MANADTQDEPVSIEEQIASVIDAQEQEDEETEIKEEQPAEDEAESSEDSESETDEGEGEDSGDDDGESSEFGDTAAEDDESGYVAAGDSEVESDDEELPVETDEKLEPPEHWSASDKEAFNEQPTGAQEWMLKRHKEIEGDYTRKRQQESSQVRLAENVTDALSPFREEFSRAGLDEAGAVRQLASWHTALKNNPKQAIQELATTYGVDLSADIDDTTDPAMQPVLQEIGALKQHLSRQEQAAQQRELERISGVIQSFKSEKDESGNLLYPHFDKVEQDIAKLMESGIVERGNLTEGYKQAVRLRGLEAPAPKPKPAPPKEDQAEKVKRAKRAATGVKSSGAVGKKDHSKMTLEEQIAAEWDSRI